MRSGPPARAGALEVEIVGLTRIGPGGPDALEIRRLGVDALAAAGIHDGHVAIEFVDERRIAELNARHRARPAPTDVLSFPVDAGAPVAGPRELGDVVICPERTRDLREAVVHGLLHLAGLDHEEDDGEMLALQRRVLAGRVPPT